MGADCFIVTIEWMNHIHYLICRVPDVKKPEFLTNSRGNKHGRETAPAKRSYVYGGLNKLLR